MCNLAQNFTQNREREQVSTFDKYVSCGRDDWGRKKQNYIIDNMIHGSVVHWSQSVCQLNVTVLGF
jgi:hypothetical protein